MDAKDRIAEMKSLHESYAKKKQMLKRYKGLMEEESPHSISKLIESDLEQAKLILAAKDVLDRLQKIAEHLAELGAEEIMPLSDNMKGAFGPDIATEFEHTANDQIQKALETVRSAKDTINSAILKVEGKIPPSNDMTNGGGNTDDQGTFDTDNMSDIGPEIENTDDETASDEFSGADASAIATPMGREKRESIESKGSVLESLGKKALVKENLNSLFTWLIEDATAKIQDPEALNNFTKVALMKAKQNPEKMAGWIAQKKYSPAVIAQMTVPQVSSSAMEPGLNITLEQQKEKLARGIAKVIEANVMAFGKGNAARVIEQFIGEDSSGLMEDVDSRTSVLEKFQELYGMSPGRYSLSVRRSIEEAGQGIPTPPSTPKPPSTPGTSVLSQEQKDKASKAVSKLASQVANNPSTANMSVDSAVSGYSTDDQAAIRDLEDNISSNNGGETSDVDDLLKASDKALGEAGPNGLKMGQGKKGKPFQTDAGLNKAKTGAPKGSPVKKSPAKMNTGSKTPLSYQGKSVSENINAALWPTDPKTGQYKGEPMSTDYGKLKPKTSKSDDKKTSDSNNAMPGTEAKTSPKKTELEGSKEKPEKFNAKLSYPKNDSGSSVPKSEPSSESNSSGE